MTKPSHQGSKDLLFTLLIVSICIVLLFPLSLALLFSIQGFLGSKTLVILGGISGSLSVFSLIVLYFYIVPILAILLLIFVLKETISEKVFDRKNLRFAILSIASLILSLSVYAFLHFNSTRASREAHAQLEANIHRFEHPSDSDLVDQETLSTATPAARAAIQAAIMRRKALVQAEADRRGRNGALRDSNIAIAKERYAYLTKLFAKPRILTETQEYGSLLFHDGDHVIRIDPIIYISDKKNVATYNDPYYWRLDLYLKENLVGQPVIIQLPSEADFIRDYCCYNEMSADEYFPAHVYYNNQDIVVVFQSWIKTHYNK